MYLIKDISKESLYLMIPMKACILYVLLKNAGDLSYLLTSSVPDYILMSLKMAAELCKVIKATYSLAQGPPIPTLQFTPLLPLLSHPPPRLLTVFALHLV